MSDGYGRRFALLVAAVFEVATLTLIALRFDDTLIRLNPDALRPGTLVRTWSTVLRNPKLLSFTALTAATYAVLFTFLASASFVFIHVLGHTCGQTGAVGPFPQAAGAASALNGFVMVLAAFFIDSWRGTHMDRTVRPLAHGISFWSACIAAIA